MLHRSEAEISNCFYVNVTRISNCLCEYNIEVKQRYQIVYVNVTAKRGKDISKCLCEMRGKEGYQIVYVNVTKISICLCECYIEERQEGYQIVYVNVTSKRDISNCLCKCYIEARCIKLFM
jgi:hypothetical protein